MGEHKRNASEPRKIGVLGTASPSLKHYPQDPKSGWELWGMCKAGVHRELREGTGCDVYFEPHERKLWADKVKILAKVEKPIYMHKHYDDVPSSVEYPLERVLTEIPAAIYGRTPLTPMGSHRSTIGYMLSLAIVELGPQHSKPKDRRDSLGVWGVEMSAEGEYGYQKPNCEALLGYALGLGINVIVPESSSLMKGNSAYGYQPRALIYSPLNYEYLFKQKQECDKVQADATRSEAGAAAIIRWLDSFKQNELTKNPTFTVNEDWYKAQRNYFLQQQVELLKTVANLDGQSRKIGEYMHLLDCYDRGAPMAGAAMVEPPKVEAPQPVEPPSNGATQEPVPVGAAAS